MATQEPEDRKRDPEELTSIIVTPEAKEAADEKRGEDESWSDFITGFAKVRKQLGPLNSENYLQAIDALEEMDFDD